MLDAFVGEPAPRASRDVEAAARAELRAIDDDLEAIGGDDRARARELDLLRFELEEIDGAELARRGRGRDARSVRRRRSPTRPRVGPASKRPGAVLDGPATDAVGEAMAALGDDGWFAALAGPARRACRRSSPTSCTRPGSRPSRWSTIPSGWPSCGPGASDCASCAGSTGRRIADVQAFASRDRRRGWPSSRAPRNGGPRWAPGRDKAERGAGEGPGAAARRPGARGAPVLAAAVTERLGELALGRAECHIEVEREPMPATVVRSRSCSRPNPGESARPLAKAASGGELSRVMLALRVVLSEAPPTLVFDEVDAGLGGEAGVAVGRALALLGGKHQVLCVTHLAQVAAFADAQLSVRKEERGGRTQALVELLLDDARVNELSRMLAGVGESAHARRHARELLTVATKQRSEARA